MNFIVYRKVMNKKAIADKHFNKCLLLSLVFFLEELRQSIKTNYIFAAEIVDEKFTRMSRCLEKCFLTIKQPEEERINK